MGQYLTMVNGRWRLRTSSPFYQKSHQPGNITALTPISLPDAMTYEGDELQVYLNGVLQNVLIDYNYVGSGSKSEIAFLFDIQVTDRLSYVTNKEIK